MSYDEKCTYTDKLTESTRLKCAQCQRKFDMSGSCCLDMCGYLQRCKGCMNGTRSIAYKEWRKNNGK